MSTSYLLRSLTVSGLTTAPQCQSVQSRIGTDSLRGPEAELTIGSTLPMSLMSRATARRPWRFSTWASSFSLSTVWVRRSVRSLRISTWRSIRSVVLRFLPFGHMPDLQNSRPLSSSRNMSMAGNFSRQCRNRRQVNNLSSRVTRALCYAATLAALSTGLLAATRGRFRALALALAREFGRAGLVVDLGGTGFCADCHQPSRAALIAAGSSAASISAWMAAYLSRMT